MPHQTFWASALSTDVWADIFSLVADEVFHDLGTAVAFREIYPEQIYNHRQYLSLRSVCKTFQTVFLSHPELSAYLFLEERQPPTAVLSLLKRLQRDNLPTRTLLAACGESSSLEAVLSGAVTAANWPFQMLTTAVIQDCSTLSLTLLSTCSSLQSCSFTQGQTTLDISALRALPRLSTLGLQGNGADKGGFSGLEELLHLAELDVESSDVGNEHYHWMFSSSLRALRIAHSSLCNMHEDGLSQCTALQSLCLEDCLIECQTMEHTLDIRQCTEFPAEMPNNLSALTELTQLELTVSSNIHGVFECPWLNKLTALKRLRLEFEPGTMRFNVTDQMLSLVNLEHLTIIQDLLADSPQNIVSLEASMHLLPMLQTIQLQSGNLKLDHRVLELVKSSSLRRLNFCRSQLLDDASVQYFGALMHEMGAKRPDVEC